MAKLWTFKRIFQPVVLWQNMFLALCWHWNLSKQISNKTLQFPFPIIRLSVFRVTISHFVCYLKAWIPQHINPYFIQRQILVFGYVLFPNLNPHVIGHFKIKNLIKIIKQPWSEIKFNWNGIWYEYWTCWWILKLMFNEYIGCDRIFDLFNTRCNLRLAFCINI